MPRGPTSATTSTCPSSTATRTCSSACAAPTRARQYLDLIARARRICPGISFSTDLIAGFCGETEAEHQATLSLMEAVRYDHAFMFMYSERPGTYAARKYTDDVPEAVKKRRLTEIIELQRRHNEASNAAEVGREHVAWSRARARRATRSSSGAQTQTRASSSTAKTTRKGDYVRVRIDACTSSTLLGTALGRTTLAEAAATDAIGA